MASAITENSMRVFVVRHEKRDRNNATFLSPLLPEGMEDASGNLVQRIGEIRPTHVYASPFLRVLQTLQPYVSSTQDDMDPLRVNVEYSLYESPNPDKDDFIGEVHQEWMAEYFLCPSYQSFLSPGPLREGWGFDESALRDRTMQFLAHLESVHRGTDDVVLLASHQYTIHSLLSLATGEEPSSMNFPQGEVAELDWQAALELSNVPTSA